MRRVITMTDQHGVAVDRNLPGCVFDDECGNQVMAPGEWMCQTRAQLVELGRSVAQEDQA